MLSSSRTNDTKAIVPPLRFYQSTLQGFQRDTSITLFEDFCEATIRSWLLTHAGVSKATLATYDRCLRVVGRWLFRRGYLPEDPMLRLPKLKAKLGPLAPFTEEDVRAMVKVARTGRNPLRDVALITLLLDTGLRVGEAMNLRLQSVDWVQGWLSVDDETGPRIVAFGRKSRMTLRRYVDQGRRAQGPSVQHLFVVERSGRRRVLPAELTSLERLQFRFGGVGVDGGIGLRAAATRLRSW